MGKVKIKPIEEVYLDLRADWDNPETFREIADRILEKEHGIQVTISGEPEITYQGEGLPNLVEYPVDVQLGSRGEAAKNIVPAVMGFGYQVPTGTRKTGTAPRLMGHQFLVSRWLRIRRLFWMLPSVRAGTMRNPNIQRTGVLSS